eukprot:scaffold302_cov247-Pinguiococcus_pyrenoidosus.AAC.36
MDRRRPELLDRRNVIPRWISLVLRQFVIGIQLRVLDHQAVPSDFRQNGGGSDDVFPAVALHKRLSAARQRARYLVPVDQRIAAALPNGSFRAVQLGARDHVAPLPRNVCWVGGGHLVHQRAAAHHHPFHGGSEDVDLINPLCIEHRHRPSDTLTTKRRRLALVPRTRRNPVDL